MHHPSSSVNSDNAGSVQKEEMDPKLKSVGQRPHSRLRSLKLRNLLESSTSPRVSRRQADCPTTPLGPSSPVSGQFPLFILRSLLPHQIGSDLFLRFAELLHLQSSGAFQHLARGLCTEKLLPFVAFHPPSASGRARRLTPPDRPALPRGCGGGLHPTLTPWGSLTK